MSKKLIAVASAAALALAGLVAMPTVATATNGPFSVSVVQSETLSRVATNGSTGDLELTVLVPSQDVIRFVDNTTSTHTNRDSNTVLRFIVNTPTSGATVTATSTGGTKLLTQAQITAGSLTTASGSQSISVTSDTSGDVTIYAFTTSTADTTVTIASGANSTTLFVKGVSPVNNAYKLNFTASPTVALGGKIAVSGTVADMFGNLLTLTDAEITTTQLGGSVTAGTVSESEFAVNATTKVHSFEITASTTATTQAINVAAATPAASVTAFGTRVASQFFSVNVTDLSAVVTSLTAQVAALKADYNALAAKWNKRVASKKAPKKAVTLK
jgi:hypothetical protein